MGDLVVGGGLFRHQDNLLSIVEFDDGKIKKEVDYFCEPFEAEEWREQWVEKI